MEQLLWILPNKSNTILKVSTDVASITDKTKRTTKKVTESIQNVSDGASAQSISTQEASEEVEKFRGNKGLCRWN